MDIILVGLSHNTAPVEVREKLSFSGQMLSDGIKRLRGYENISECLMLSTCNRGEIYAIVDQSEIGIARIKDFLHSYQTPLPLESISQPLYIHKNEAAVKHLFRFAASLDSMVVGEPQILGQVKDAFDTALLNKTTGVILNKLFKNAIPVAIPLRTATSIA